MPTFDVIAFDADDTLWHTEYLYRDAQTKFRAILTTYLTGEDVDERLYEAEMRNLKIFGYGIKAFALSMIESAIELTQGNIKAVEIQTLLDISKEMLAAEVQLVDHALDTLAGLARSHTLMLITKGDLYDQEAKITRSGIASHFTHIEVVSAKQPETYQNLLNRYRIPASRFMMVGNSPRSDILPVLAIGGHAVYIPYPVTWSHEDADLPSAGHPGYFELANISELPDLVTRLSAS